MVLGTRPTSARDAVEYEDKRFGLTVREITTDIRIALNLSEDRQADDSFRLSRSLDGLIRKVSE